MSKITLKDLAKMLKMSISTVSKGLNDSYEISEATKKKIRQLAEKHNYQPNLFAKNLKIGKTNTIGIIIPFMANPVQSQILEGAHKAALENNFHIVFMQSRDNSIIEKSCIEFLINQNVDGIMISPASQESNVDYIKHVHENITPIILFDRVEYPLETHKVGVNSFVGTYNATKHLLDIGRKRIAVLCGKNLGVTSERLNGYLKALEDNSISIDPDLIIYCDYNKTKEQMDYELKKELIKLMKQENAPDAILGTTDTLTTRVLGILSETKYTVPEDLAVIGFANTELAQSLNPSLSTIKQPAFDIGYIATNKLIRLANEKDRSDFPYESILLETTIQLRNSTKI